MSLTAADLLSIESIVVRVVESKLNEKLAPIQGELTAQGNDIKAIYHLLKRKQSKTAANRQYRRLETMILAR
jgi:Skp family chaperone for outer membrane proteins